MPRIKTPMKEGVAVLVYATDEEYVWVAEYLRNGKADIALVSCHKKHKVGDQVKIIPGNMTKIPIFREV